MSLLARMDRLPLSRVHRKLLVIGGLGYTFDGMDGAIVAFLMPSVAEVWNLGNAQLGLVGSATPIGFLIGAILSGMLGDRIGRKKVMMYALLFYCVMTILAAVAPNFGLFMVFRVLAGLGTGAESVIIAPYLSEFVPAARRGWFVGALAGFFSFGYLAAAVLGRLIVPNVPDGWRWAQVVTALPILLVLWWRRSLHESPRFLISHGRVAEAQEVVEYYEQAVVKETGRELEPVSDTVADDAVDTDKHGFLRALSYMWSAAMRRRTLTTWIIWFVITFAYYGFFNWIPTLLVQRGITVTKSFQFSIIIFAAQIPGYFSAAWVSEKLDRKNTIAVYLAGSALSAYWLSQSGSVATITLAGAVLSFFLNGTYAALYSYTPEVFPTWLRTTGVGLASACGRIGSITAPMLIGFLTASWGFGGVFTLVTIILAAGVATVVLFGVSTAGRSLERLNEEEVEPVAAR